MALAVLGPDMCCASRPEDRIVAFVLVPLLLEANVADESLCRFFQVAVARLPLGANAILALHLLETNDYAEKLLRLDLPLERNKTPEPIDYLPIVPNVFLGQKSVATFLATEAGDMMGKMLEELEAAYTGNGNALVTINWLKKGLRQNLGAILESILPLTFPPLLIAYVNFQIMNFALPSGIRLGAWETASLLREEKPRHSNRWFKNFFEFKSRLFAALKKEEYDAAGGLLLRLGSVIPGIAHPGDKILCRALLKILQAPIRQRNPSVKDLIRLVNELPRVHRSWQVKRRVGKVYGITSKAFEIYRDVAVASGSDLPEKLFRRLKAKSKAVPRQYFLCHPSEGRELYFQGMPPSSPSAADPAVSADYIKHSFIRIMANMMWEFGVRSVSFLEIELRHIVMTERFVSIIVPSSKGKVMQDCELVASWLWPVEELKHLREFVGWLKSKGLFDPKVRVTELAGFGRFEGKDSSPAAYRAVEKGVRAYFRDVDGPKGLHIPRIQFASWFPIRCLVAHHRWLRDESILSCCKDDPWFTDEALDRLLNLYPSECYSVLEIERRILMQASPREIVLTYLRTLPVLVELWANPRLQKAI
jgi:hypothetical protein